MHSYLIISCSLVPRHNRLLKPSANYLSKNDLITTLLMFYLDLLNCLQERLASRERNSVRLCAQRLGFYSFSEGELATVNTITLINAAAVYCQGPSVDLKPWSLL